MTVSTRREREVMEVKANCFLERPCSESQQNIPLSGATPFLDLLARAPNVWKRGMKPLSSTSLAKDCI
jgi:hypothetical protein